MRVNTRELEAIIEPVVAGLGYEFVGIERTVARRAPLIRVYIDSASGITLRDCERVSQQVSSVMDVEDPVTGSYTLEVSSPGLDRRLFTLDLYSRFLQSTVSIETMRLVHGRRKFRGRLNAVTVKEISITEQEGEVFTLPFDLIHRARLVPQFESKKPARRSR